jgi:acyl carrier protein
MSDRRAECQEAILAFIRDHLAQDPAQVTSCDQPLISSGLIDSFSLVELALFIEEELGVTVPDADMTVKNFDTAALGAHTVMRCAG